MRRWTRRSVLASIGTGMTASLAGCSDIPIIGSGSSLEVVDTESDAGVGTVVVVALVQNTGSSDASDTLRTQVDVQGGDTYTERQEVTVPAESSNSYRMTHDLSFSTTMSGGQYSYSASIV